MVDTEMARTIVGIIGNVISLFLFLSPMATFIHICRGKSVQSYKPDPYLATIFNCGMWLIYGFPFVHEDSTLILTINSVGLLIEGAFITIFIMYSEPSKRKKIFIILLAEIIIWAIVFVITMVLLHGTKSRSLFVGLCCIVVNIIMYTSPLTVMRQVVRTRSVKYMPFTLSLANLLNGAIWTTYALLRFDLFIVIPNALGTLSGLVQMILYTTFYRMTKWNDDEKPARVVELPSSNV